MLWESSTGSCLWVRLRIITNATLFVVRRRWDDSTQSLGRWSRFSVGVLSSPSLIFSCFVDFHCTRIYTDGIPKGVGVGVVCDQSLCFLDVLVPLFAFMRFSPPWRALFSLLPFISTRLELLWSLRGQ
jgi:hypothetical protein